MKMRACFPGRSLKAAATVFLFVVAGFSLRVSLSYAQAVSEASRDPVVLAVQKVLLAVVNIAALISERRGSMTLQQTTNVSLKAR